MRIAQTPAASYISYLGYLVTIANGTATVNASTSVLSKGVIVEPNDTAAGYASEKVSVELLAGSSKPTKVRCGGTIVKGAFVQQHSDGTIITDAGSGARVIVGIALESGASGDNIDVALMPAITLS
jgi:hypothetical protein